MLHLFEAMAALLQLPQLAFFKHYRNDFFEHDRRELVDWGAPGARYLWVVRASGSHIVRLGVHPKHHEYGIAVIEQLRHARGAEARIFEVSSHTIAEIDSGSALRLLAAGPFEFQVRGSSIVRRSRGGVERSIASLRIDLESRYADLPLRHVRITAADKLTAEEIGALRIISQCEVMLQAHSLFAAPASILIDGADISDAMQAVRVAAPVETEVKVKWLSGPKAYEDQRGQVALA